MYPVSLTALICLLCISCAPKTRTISKHDIRKSFRPLLKFMDVKPGAVLADVGAGSGAITVAMSSLMDSSIVYIQDIDSIILNQRKLESALDLYSDKLHTNLRAKNTYRLAFGDLQHTNLPDRTFDVIYTNATAHVFSSPDSIFRDIGRKLKPGGVLFIRDCFVNLYGSGTVCSDKKCARPLFSTAGLIELMERNHFILVKESPSMSGYPVLGFSFRRERD